MENRSNYNAVPSKKEDNTSHVAYVSTLQDAGNLIRTLDSHPTGGLIFLLIVTAIIRYLSKKKGK